MASILKTAIVIGRELGNKLTVRYGDAAAGPLSVTLGSDTSGNPTISVGSGVAGTDNVFMRVTETPTLGLNAFGSAQDSYGPHIIQMALETSGTAHVPLITAANLFRGLIEVMRMGARVDLFLSANGVAPVVGTLIASNLEVSVDDLYFPTVRST